MRYYPAGLSGMPGGREGVASGLRDGMCPQGRQGMLLANWRIHEKVVVMRSRPTGAAPIIDADVPSSCPF